MAKSADNRVCVGIITGAHGIRGEIKLKSFMENPSDIALYAPLTSEDGRKVFKLEKLRISGKHFICKIEGVLDRTEAESLRNTGIYVERNQLPELDEVANEWYYSDLAGLEVRLPDGRVAGTVISVQNYGAGDLLEIQLKSQKQSEFLPFTEEVFPTICVNEGYIILLEPEYIIAQSASGSKTGKMPD